jgi:hypothetical protein
MVSGLTREFSRKTKDEQDKIFSELMLAPVMGTDCTNARVDGKSSYVYVCATPAMAMYFARAHKGHEGVSKTPVEDYQGILVHDHDMTFYKYGNGHQECLAHILRYLKDSTLNEPGLKWNTLMRELIREIIHYRNGLEPDEEIDPQRVAPFESRYKEILNIAKEEYEYEPPSDYYKDGYNLYLRLGEYMGNHLLFLHDKRVPHNNNRSERLLRVYKRKQKQVMTLRSFDSLDYLCRSMGVLDSLRSQNKNVYRSVTEIFD